MGYTLRNDGAALVLCLVFLTLSAAALAVSWAVGRVWGDLSSRRRAGEALTEAEQEQLRRSRRRSLLWMGACVLLTVLAFLVL